MNNNSWKGVISPGPCSADQFSGRFDEQKKLIEAIREAKDRAQVIMISGSRGSGKSSFLNWAEKRIQIEGEGCPAIIKGFNEMPGMVVATYRELLNDIREHDNFRWLGKTLDQNYKIIDSTISIMEKASHFFGPQGVGIRLTTTLMRMVLQDPNISSLDYNQFQKTFLKILSDVGEELKKNNKILGILLDDIQYSTGPDLKLLKHMIQNLPSGILLIITFRLEEASQDKYNELKKEIIRNYYHEIQLSKMNEKDIKAFAKQQYDLSLDDQSAIYLSENIGVPLCLVSCFNALQKQKLEPILSNFQDIGPKALKDPTSLIYSDLDKSWQERITSLCVLPQPMNLSTISCMLKHLDIARLKEELDNGHVFIRLDQESYDFAHPSLRVYCKEQLPESKKKELSLQAIKCLKSAEARL